MVIRVTLTVVVTAGAADVAGVTGERFLGDIVGALGICIHIAAEFTLFPVVVDIASPLHECGVCGLSDDILYIVLLICDNGIGLCDLARKCAVGPALAAFAAFPVLDIALMLVDSVDAGRLDGIVMDNDIGAGVCVLTKLIGLVAGLDENAAVCAVDIAAVAFAVDGGIDCIAGLFYQMIVGVGFTVGKAAGSADSRRLAVCRAAGVRAGILSGVANDAFLSMI